MKTGAPTYLRSWHGYGPIATIAQEPEELRQKVGLEFRRTHDDLDELLEAAIFGESGRVFGLVKHLNSPTPGTQIYWRTAAGDLPEALCDVLDALGLADEAVTWVRPASAGEATRPSTDG